MARAYAANPGRRSQKAAGAVARDPWEEAAAALRSRTPPDTWGTGTRQSIDARVTDAWGTWTPTGTPDSVLWGAMTSTEAPVTVGWGAMPSTEAPVTVAWGAMLSTDATMTGSWGIGSLEAALVMSSWGPRASTEAPFSDTWGARTSKGSLHRRLGYHGVDGPLPPRASEAARDAWGHGPSDAADNPGGSAPKMSCFTVPTPSGSEVLMNITVGNAKTFLHCGVCSLPLKPPIFQCDAGHAVCSACRDEPLGRGTGRTCDVCGGPGYRQCRLMDGLVASLRVACPNAAHGCDATPAYYDLHAHRMACAHAPGTRCPVGCDFVAPVPKLLDHLTAVHWWPLTIEGRTGKSFDTVLCDGFNIVATATAGRDQQYLLLLNLVKQPFGRTISAVCIHPLPAAVESSVAAVPKTVELELRHWAACHYQESEFNVPFVDLADGLPDDLAQFVVPKAAHPDDDDTVPVTAFLTIK